jgi:hypothetical protein
MGVFRGAMNRNGCAAGFADHTVDWTLCTSGLQRAGADVLHLLDCDFPVQVADTCAEIIAVSVTGGLETGFTRALIEELEANATVMTAANLHARLMRRGGAVALFYKERWGRESCVLRRLDDACVQSEREDGTREGKRILVGVAVQENLDVQMITTWLSSLNGPGGMEIEVSGLWDDFLMFTVPIEVWTQLPTESEWVYIVGVAGGNKMLVNKMLVNKMLVNKMLVNKMLVNKMLVNKMLVNKSAM